MIRLIALRTFAGVEGFIRRGEEFEVATRERADHLIMRGFARLILDQPIEEPEQPPMAPPPQPPGEPPDDGGDPGIPDAVSEIFQPRVVQIVEPGITTQPIPGHQGQNADPIDGHQTNNVFNEDFDDERFQEDTGRNFTGQPINDGTDDRPTYVWLHENQDTTQPRLDRNAFQDRTATMQPNPRTDKTYMVGNRPIRPIEEHPPLQVNQDPSGVGYVFTGPPDPFEQVVQYVGDEWYQLPNGERVKGYDTARAIFDHYTNFGG